MNRQGDIEMTIKTPRHENEDKNIFEIWQYGRNLENPLRLGALVVE